MPVLAWLLRGRNNSNTTFGPRVLNSGVWGMEIRALIRRGGSGAAGLQWEFSLGSNHILD